jgi:hypothetical protein
LIFSLPGGIFPAVPATAFPSLAMNDLIPRQYSADAGPAWAVHRLYTALTNTTLTAITAAPPTDAQISDNDSTHKRLDRNAINYCVVIDDVLVSADALCAVTFTEETTGTVLAKVYLSANAPMQITLRDMLKLETSTAGKKIMAQLSTTANASFTCHFHYEPV